MFNFSETTRDELANYVMRVSTEFQVKGAMRTRFERIDRGLQREADKTKEALASAKARYGGDLSKIPDFELPLGFVQYDAALAWLTSVFATGVPMFRTVSNKKLEKVASMMSALVGRDQTRYGWTGEMVKTLGQLLRYNLTAMEWSWKTEVHNTVVTRLSDGDVRTGAADSVTVQGNALRNLQMYNTIYDHTCPPNEVHKYGAFAGYIERFNYIRAKMFTRELDDTYLIKPALKHLFKVRSDGTIGSTRGLYYTPNIRLSDPVESQLTGQSINWELFFGFDSKNKVRNKGEFEAITLYARIIPIEFQMKVPARSQVQVWKLIVMNGILIYAEPVTSGHGYLPIVLSQAYDEGMDMQNKSFVENILPIQDVGTSIVKGTMGAMRRNIADRGIYNQAMINPEDINAESPTAKIPARLNRFNTDLRAAYLPIDYRDTVTPQFTQNLGMILGFADQVNGINQAQQGNFVKGNKTLFEFSTIMSKADSRLQLLALNFENSGLTVGKQIIKINYLINAQNELLQDPDGGEDVNVDPVELRKLAPEFRMADGLFPATKLGNTEVLMAAFNLMGQNQDLAIDYKLGDIVVSVLRQQGFDDIDSYKRTDQERQQYIMQLQAMQQPPQEENTDGQQ